MYQLDKHVNISHFHTILLMFIDQNIVLLNVLKSVIENKHNSFGNKMSIINIVHPFG